MLPSRDTVLAMVRGHPDGVTIPDLIAEYAPTATATEREILRRKMYDRLKHLEKFDMVTRTTVPARIQGGHTTTWRVCP